MSAIFKAEGIGGQPVPDLNLSATREIEITRPGYSISGWENKLREFYDDQARLVFNQLSASLPGGTIDALLRVMLEHKACLFVTANKS